MIPFYTAVICLNHVCNIFFKLDFEWGGMVIHVGKKDASYSSRSYRLVKRNLPAHLHASIHSPFGKQV